MLGEHLYFAAAHAPLFGNAWLALSVVLAGVAVLMLVVMAIGRWLAATHPYDPMARAPALQPASNNDIPPRILAAIAAAIEVAEGSPTRITAVTPAKVAAPSVEMLMQQWSIEGRRQIYSSHQLRGKFESHFHEKATGYDRGKKL